MREGFKSVRGKLHTELGAYQHFDHLGWLRSTGRIIRVEDYNSFFGTTGIEAGGVGYTDGESGASMYGGVTDIGVEMIQDGNFTDNSLKATISTAAFYRDRAGD